MLGTCFMRRIVVAVVLLLSAWGVVWIAGRREPKASEPRAEGQTLPGYSKPEPAPSALASPDDGSLDSAPADRMVEAPTTTSRTLAVTTGRIHGHARDQDGRPLAKYSVWLLERKEPIDRYRVLGREDERHVLERATTDSDGAYEFGNVASGEWWVGIPVLEFAWERDPKSSLLPVASSVQIRPGNLEPEIDVVAYRGLTVQGSVSTPDGTPVYGAYVLATATAREDSRELGSVQVDKEGRFVLGPVPSGRFFVRAGFMNKFLPSKPTMVMAGAGDVHLVLGSGGHLLVTAVDAQSNPVFVESLMTVLHEDDGLSHAYVPRNSVSGSQSIDVEGLGPGA